MSGDWPFHDITEWYYVWGLTFSWQNWLILCLGLDHFMTKQTDTMSGARPFHDKTDWYYVWAWLFHDITDSHYVWGLTISWHNRMILCLGLDHFMTKQTDTMSGAWPFYNKSDWYYVLGLTISRQTDGYYIWVLTISWQSTLMLCLGLDHFMTKQTDTISGAWPFHDKIDWYYVWGLTIL
jgi:hypothetical protein